MTDPASSDRPSQIGAAMQTHSYLQETGWLESNVQRVSIDASRQPIPWYRYAAIDFLEERVDKNHRVFEFGSGNSTLWWAQRSKSVTAVEHEPAWAARVRQGAPENVTLLQVPLVTDGEYSRTPHNTNDRYEIMILDGRDRVNCALRSLGALTDDGVIIWDDSHRLRYRSGLAFLAERGFRRLRFTGLGPIAANNGETSVLYRSSNCFGI